MTSRHLSADLQRDGWMVVGLGGRLENVALVVASRRMACWRGDVTGKRRAGSSMLPSATPGIGRVSGNRTSPEDGVFFSSYVEYCMSTTPPLTYPLRSRHFLHTGTDTAILQVLL